MSRNTNTNTNNSQQRDRWAGSSDEEETSCKRKAGRSKSGGKNKKTKSATTTTTTTTSTSSTSTTQRPEDDNANDNDDQQRPQRQLQEPLQLLQRHHNPLLHGCRSVYDTYEQIERLSEGAYGIVWKARALATTTPLSSPDQVCCFVALKQIKFHAALEHSTSITMYNHSRGQQVWKEGFPVTALREISVLLALSGHANVVSVKEMVVGDAMDKVYMVMEYFDCDLKNALAGGGGGGSGGGPLSQSNLKGILQQILTGMAHVHGHRYLHRDMKPSNLLVQRQTGRIALADFGLARRYWCHGGSAGTAAAAGPAMTLPVVTLWYRAPELLFGEARYGPAIDIWSIGCIFGELILSGGNYSNNDGGENEDDDEGNAILKGRGEIDQIDQIFSLLGGPTEANWPSFQSLPNASLLRWKSVAEPHFHQVFRSNSIASSSHATFLDDNGLDLLQSMLRLDPHRRITAQAALDHAYFVQGVKPSIPHFFTAALQSS